MEGNVKKTTKKVSLKPFGEVANFAEPLHFFRKTFFKGTMLEKLLRIQLPCCIYLEGCPRVVLYNSNKNYSHTTRQSKNMEENVKQTT